jgi:hypothetical protein
MVRLIREIFVPGDKHLSKLAGKPPVIVRRVTRGLRQHKRHLKISRTAQIDNLLRVIRISA